MHRIVLAAEGARQRKGLGADDARAAICLSRIDAAHFGVRLGAGNEEGLCLMHGVKPSEVEIATIHDVECIRLQHQNVENFHIAQLAVRDVDKAGHIASQVKQRMHLHRRLGGAKQRPRKQRQAQVDGRRIERVRRVLQLDTKTVAEVKLACLRDQALSEFGTNAPVPRFVGIGQRRAFYLVPEAHVIKLVGLRRQTDLNITQTFAVSQLGKGHHPELFGAGKRFGVAVATLSINKSSEGRPRQKIHQLREQRLACVHERLRVGLPRNFFGSSF